MKTETIPPRAETQEVESGFEVQHKLDVLRRGYYAIHHQLQEANAPLPPSVSSIEVIDLNIEKAEGDAQYLDTLTRWGIAEFTNIALSSDLTLRDISREDAVQQVGFLDEDSFAFSWGVMEQFAELEESSDPIEEATLKVLEQLRRFTSTEEGFERCVQDPRLAGVLHIYAAVEFAQVRDFEAAATEIDAIAEDGLRDRFSKILAHTLENESQSITTDESVANYQRWITSISPSESDIPDGEVETAVVSNRSIATLRSLFDPYSNGRFYADTADSRIRNSRRRPSSGDHWIREETEKTLGHPRRLFTPRVAYGALVEADRIDALDDNAWAFGDVRFVFDDESRAVQAASYTLGDSLNGTTFDKNRRVNREEANQASQLLRRYSEHRSEPIGRGDTTHYIETQLEGFHITDIKKVIIRHTIGDQETREEKFQLAEVAALHGIEAKYIVGWEELMTSPVYASRSIEENARLLLEGLQAQAEKYPHVRITVRLPEDKETKRIFEQLGHGSIKIT